MSFVLLVGGRFIAFFRSRSRGSSLSLLLQFSVVEMQNKQKVDFVISEYVFIGVKVGQTGNRPWGGLKQLSFREQGLFLHQKH